MKRSENTHTTSVSRLRVIAVVVVYISFFLTSGVTAIEAEANNAARRQIIRASSMLRGTAKTIHISSNIPSSHSFSDKNQQHQQQQQFEE